MKVFNIKSVLALAATVLFTSTVFAGFTSFQSQPNSVFVNTPTKVEFTAIIAQSPSLIKQSVQLQSHAPSGWKIVGTMHDDGLLGDTLANDNKFTLQVSLNEANVDKLSFRVSAAYKGVVKRDQSPIIQIDVKQLSPETGTEDLSTGLKGTDANSNGIRDDIDRLIETKFSQTPAVKKAAEQKALALQAMLEATTKTQVFTAIEKISRAGECVYKVLPEHTIEQEKIRDGMSKEIEALTANTRERLVKYLDSNKLAGGGYFPDPIEPVCD